MTVASPHLYIEPTVLIGTDEVQCYLSMVTLVPTVTFTDAQTYCAPGTEAPSQIKWGGIMRARMSYGSDASWNFFSALDATEPQSVTIYPSDPGTTTGTQDVPEASFDAYITPIAFIPDHEIGASATYDIEFRVVGAPDFATT